MARNTKQRKTAPSDAYDLFTQQAGEMAQQVHAAASGDMRAHALVRPLSSLAACLVSLIRYTDSPENGSDAARGELHRALHRYARVLERASLVFRGASMEMEAGLASDQAQMACRRVIRDLECDEGPDVWHGFGAEIEVRARLGRLLDGADAPDEASAVRMRGLWRIFAGDDFGTDTRELITYDDGNHLAEALAVIAADFAGRGGDLEAQWLLGHVAQLVRHLREPDLYPTPELAVWPPYERWKAAHSAANDKE